MSLSFTTLLPRQLRFALRYMRMHRRFSLLTNPQRFSEKLFYRLVYDRRELFVTLADKLTARDYVRERIGDHILTKIYATADLGSRLDWQSLPSKFVLKANHGSGFVRIVTDKSEESFEHILNETTIWLNTNYGCWSREWFYEKINRRLFCEEFISGPSSMGIAHDYKFFVFSGKVFMIVVDRNRFSKHTRDFYTPDWERIALTSDHPNGSDEVPRPDKLPEMIAIASELGRDIDFVRVDLYESGNRVLFGEFTLCPWGGGRIFTPDAFDITLGRQWQISVT